MLNTLSNCSIGRSLSILATIIALASSPGCDNSPAVSTVPGPEATDLVAKLYGQIVTNDGGSITVVSLPDATSKSIYTPPRDAEGHGSTIHALSGPDSDGRIAYIDDFFFMKDDSEQRHLLKTIKIDGTKDTEVFSRPGSAMWATSAAGHGEIGTYVALAPKGGHAAIISHTKSRQMPQALLNLGSIEIWDVFEKKNDETNILALDEPMSWFPDGRRLSYSTLVAPATLPSEAKADEYFGDYFGHQWDEIPAVYIYDMNARTSTFFHVGWTAVISSDGESALVGGWTHDRYLWWWVDVKTGTTTAWPGSNGDTPKVLGVPRSGAVVYVGLPTAGAPINLTKNNSPLRGPKEMLAVKVSDHDGKAFQTIVPYIDPRSSASFGERRSE